MHLCRRDAGVEASAAGLRTRNFGAARAGGDPCAPSSMGIAGLEAAGPQTDGGGGAAAAGSFLAARLGPTLTALGFDRFSRSAEGSIWPALPLHLHRIPL